MKGQVTMDESVPKEIGQRMKARRDELGLSQEAVSRRAGISREAYRANENGKSVPTFANLAMIANALQVEMGALLPPMELEEIARGAGLEPATYRLTAGCSAG